MLLGVVAMAKSVAKAPAESVAGKGRVMKQLVDQQDGYEKNACAESQRDEMRNFITGAESPGKRPYASGPNGLSERCRLPS